jgi:hypothetical protein
MKIPETPPSTSEILEKLIKEPNNRKLAQILSSEIGLTDTKGRYLHWEKLKHLPPPDGLSSEEYWFAIKIARQKVSKTLPLSDKHGHAFCFCIPETLQKELHWLDQNAAGSITITLHFMIGYDHPFVDGNGRTARALFYWAMAKHGYWLLEFVSISRIIKQAPIQYAKAYLQTETDDNDLTYFLIHQIDVIKKAVTALYEYLENHANDIEAAEKLLENSKARGQLNHRQLSLLKHALKHPNAIYSIQEHQIYHAISYQTARKDLLKMSDQLELLRKRKYGNSFVFVSPPDLKDRLT